MKTILISALVMIFSVPAFSQCAFQTTNVKSRHDQYSKSSKSNIDKSKKLMAEQGTEFDKKKYQSDLAKNNNNNAAQKHKSVMRYM